MREQPNYKADLVQRSSIATAVTVRTGRKVTSGEVKSVARHLGIDAITKGDHEKYYTKLQAIGITEALMHKVKLEMEARAAAAPAAPPAPATPPASVEEMLDACSPAELKAALERKGWTVVATKEEQIVKIITL